MAALIARLKHRPEFRAVARARRKAVTPSMIVQAAVSSAAGAAPGGFRVGYTASRKVGNAVARNRARRRLRAAVARVLPGHARGGLDYVIIARKKTVSRSFAALLSDLETAVDRIGMPRSEPAGRRRP